MKVRILLAGLLLWTGIGQLSAKELKVLMIGNSFSASVGKNLPQVVHSFPGYSLELTGVHIGGCSLERHAQNLKLAEENPKKGRYGVMVWNSAKPDAPEKSTDTLNNMLNL